jgi:hypothetical protein
MHPDWYVYVYDLERGLRLTLDLLPYRFALPSSRGFRLVAGTQAYVQTQEAQSGIALRTQLVSAAPNPFREDVRLTIFLAGKDRIRLQIYSVDGKLVSSLTGPELDGGLHTITWPGISKNGAPVAPGVYFLSLETKAGISTTKVLKLR